MLMNYIDEFWLGKPEKKETILPSDSEETKILKILQQCKNGDFNNIELAIRIVKETSNVIVREFGFKILMMLLTDKQMKEVFQELEEMFDELLENDPDCNNIILLSHYIKYSLSLNSITLFLEIYKDIEGLTSSETICYNIADIIFKDYDFGKLYSIEELEVGLKKSDKKNVDYYFKGNNFDIINMADYFLSSVEKCKNKNECYFDESLLTMLGVFTGIEPPNILKQQIDKKSYEQCVRFVEIIKKGTYKPNTKYFYGYEIC